MRHAMGRPLALASALRRETAGLRAECASFSSASDADARERAASGASASTSAGAGQELPYPTYTRLGPLQRGALAVFSAFGAALDPKRADLVATLGETTGEAAFRRMRERMLKSPTGRQILLDRPRITDQVLAAAAALPEGTFGHAYGRFMGRRAFAADDRPPVRFLADAELAYVAQRAREVHDLWHVLFACPTTVQGELALKALEFVQTGLPMAALSVLGAQFRLKPEERARLLGELLPWALQAGTRCADLMCLRYESHFADELDALRRQWRISPAPMLPRHRRGNVPAAVGVQ